VLEVEKLGQTTVGKVKTEWLTKGALSPTESEMKALVSTAFRNETVTGFVPVGFLSRSGRE
jgi:hypothetical protein